VRWAARSASVTTVVSALPLDGDVASKVLVRDFAAGSRRALGHGGALVCVGHALTPGSRRV